MGKTLKQYYLYNRCNTLVIAMAKTDAFKNYEEDMILDYILY